MSDGERKVVSFSQLSGANNTLFLFLFPFSGCTSASRCRRVMLIARVCLDVGDNMAAASSLFPLRPHWIVCSRSCR